MIETHELYRDAAFGQVTHRVMQVLEGGVIDQSDTWIEVKLDLPHVRRDTFKLVDHLRRVKADQRTLDMQVINAAFLVSSRNGRLEKRRNRT